MGPAEFFQQMAEKSAKPPGKFESVRTAALFLAAAIVGVLLALVSAMKAAFRS